MRSGQIVKGKIGGVQRRFQSFDLPQITEARLSELTDNSQIGTFYRFFKDERIIAGMTVTEAENSDGRHGGTVKHIVLYQHDRIFTHENEQYLFDVEQYISKLPRVFKMPPFPEVLENPLPLPLPLEWKVPL
jgi:hypothetical protein